MKLNEFKIRASQAGILMTRGGASSKTVQSYLKDWVKEQIYGIKKDVSSKYLEKGNVMENEAIDFAVSNLNIPFTMKNIKSYEDDFFTGTPDIILDDTIMDTKCSWDAFTFPLFEKFMKSKTEPYAEFRNYFYQGQVYMHLTGRKHHKVVYCLMNTPEDVDPWGDHHDYSNVPAKYRLREWMFDYNAEMIKQLQREVLECRKYIKKLTKKM